MIGSMVLVEWEDIMSWTGWNQELIDNNEDEPEVFRTIGFVIRDTKTKLTISDTYPQIGSVVVFPKGCIRKITKLSVKD